MVSAGLCINIFTYRLRLEGTRLWSWIQYVLWKLGKNNTFSHGDVGKPCQESKLWLTFSISIFQERLLT
jgi:hypothetical protein